MPVQELTSVINCFIFTVFLLQPTVALSIQDIAGLCRNWSSIFKDGSFYNVHSISIERKFNFRIIRLFVADKYQYALFAVYIPIGSLDVAPILQYLSDIMHWDEKDTPQREERNIHLVCLPQSNFVAQEGCSGDHPGVRIPVYEEVYIVPFTSESQDSNETTSVQDWFELYSLGDCLLVKRLGTFNVRILNVDYIDTTELWRLSFRRDNLYLSPVRVVSQKEEGYEKCFDLDIINGSTVFHGGTQYKMSLDYQYMLNFTYVPVFGMGWPRKLARNGTCLNGMGEQLFDKDADFMSISATWTEMRVEKLFFMPAIGFAENGIFYRGRSAHLSSRGLLLLPFKSEMWLLSGVAVITLLLSSVIIGCVVGHFRIRNTSAGGVSMWVMGVLFCQGNSINPPTLSIRAVVLTAALTSSLLYNAYTGAFLASVSSPPSELKNFDGFKKLGFTVFTDPDLFIYAEDFIRDADDQLQLEINSRKLYKDMKSLVERVLDTEQQIAAVYRSDGFYGAALALNLSSREFCEISFIPASRQSRPKESFLVRKGWPYRELFTQKTVMLIERGLGHLYFNAFLRQTQPPCILTWKYDNMISFVQCHGAFGILIVGACAALLVFHLERLYITIRVKFQDNKNL